MAPAWLPDWRNQSQYPNPTTTTGVEWAWQFLRRNPAYQRQYATPRRKMGTGLKMPAGVAKDFIEQFGIATLPPPDPAHPSPTLRFCSVHSIQKPSSWPAGREFAFSTVLDYDQVLVWFDLNWPINYQLISAKKLLNEAAPRRKPFRVRPDQYLDYLRLLDAKVVRATHSQIASILYKRVTNVHPTLEGNRRVRKDLKIAERLRDQDYWRIAAGVK